MRRLCSIVARAHPQKGLPSDSSLELLARVRNTWTDLGLKIFCFHIGHVS